MDTRTVCLDRISDTRARIAAVRAQLAQQAPSPVLAELVRVVEELEARVNDTRGFVVQEICAHHERVLVDLSPEDLARIEEAHPLIPAPFV